MDGPVRRPFVFLVALVMIAAAFAGCSDSEKDEVLREGAIGLGDQDPFNVPEGTKKLTFTFSTKSTSIDCNKRENMYTLQCVESWDSDEFESEETITFKALHESQADDAGAVPPVFVTMSYGQTSTKTLSDPMPGTWVLGTTSTSEEAYEGPAAASVAIPGTGSGGDGVLNLGPFWDIFGVIIALVGFLGAWIIYRRRARFMSSQLNRIDDTFSRFSDDLTECRTNLIELKKELNVMLVKRKLEEPQYLILEKRIEQYLQDLDIPGNRHEPAPVPPSEFVTVFESEEDIIGPGSALERLRQRRTTED